jgi:phospholysine phosphohistidine inorganic pyrophosphate phosphatase
MGQRCAGIPNVLSSRCNRRHQLNILPVVPVEADSVGSGRAFAVDTSILLIPLRTARMTAMAPEALRGLLFDLDGMLYNSDQLITGAVKAVQWVQGHRIPHLFVTNTTSHSRAVLVEKLTSFGFLVSESQILTPAVAAAEWLKWHDAQGIALFVRPSIRREFADLPCLPEQAEAGASHVVMGDLGEYWDYRTLNRAFRLLHDNSQAQLIALGMTRYWRTASGISLAVGPFVAALENATGRKALVFGKPATPFFCAATEKLGLAPAQVLMIGNDLKTDIGGAQAAGLKRALVETGKFLAADLDGSVQSDVVLDSIANLPHWWSGE